MEIPGYRILREIGRGGMSTVYLAVQKSLEREVALKVMSQGFADDEAFKERFLLEGRIVARLNHRDIVTIHDVGIVDHTYFIAMEYVVGRSLEERIQEGLTLRQSTRIVKRVARTLGHAHDHGFVHRDIKPSNILFRHDRDAVLADFGIAKSLQEDGGLTATGLTPGTPNYMSPEQLRGRPIDGRSDLYSLGVVMYEMLTGERPFEADTPIASALRRISEPPPELPVQFSSLRPFMARALAQDPAERFSNASELVRALEAAVAQSEVAALDSNETVSKPDVEQTESASRKPERAPSSPAEQERIRLERTPPPGSAPSKLEQALVSRNDEKDVARPKAALESRKRSLLWTISGGMTLMAAAVALTPLILERTEKNAMERLNVEQLLTTADRQLEAEQFFQPRGDNAYQTYQQVLAIEPGDPEAAQGMRRIAGGVEQEAHAALSLGNFDQSLVLIDKGLSVDPEDQSLRSLKEEIRGQISAENNRQQKAQTLAQAKARFEAGRWIEPPGDNALEAYQEVLNDDPGNRQAATGISEIIKRLEEQARATLRVGDYQQALAQIGEALKAFPEQREFVALRSDILAMQEQRDQQRGIASLLTQAEDQISDDNYLKAEGGGALDTYQEIIRLDPSSDKAKRGLQAIAAHFLAQGREAYSLGKTEKALAAVSNGLSAVPEDTALLGLQSEIRQRQAQDTERERRLADLLALAETQMSASHLMAPEGDNAYGTYQQVLKLEPGNEVARNGIEEIASRIPANAREKYQSGSLEESLALVNQGLQANPRNARLMALDEQIQEAVRRKLQAENKQERINELLELAKQQIQAVKLTLPAGNNALESYQQVLSLDANNAKAKAGLREIAGRYTQLAQDKRAAGDLQEALAMAERGLAIEPKHPMLQSLREDISREIDKRAARDRQMEQLLAEAQRHLEAGRLTEPQDENALRTYRGVLEIDPRNEQALQGMQAVTDRYVALAEAEFAKGEFRDGLKLVALGLKVDSESSALRSLQADIQDSLRARNERERALRRLYAQTQAQLAQQKLSEPAGDNAYETIQAIFQIDPGNARAEQALGRLLAEHESLARAYQRDGELQKSISVVAKALAIEPQNADLLALQESLDVELAARRQVQAEPPVVTQDRPEPAPTPEPEEEAEEPFEPNIGTF